MSMQAFQRLLVEITLSPRKARALRAGETWVTEGLDLTDRERARLSNIVRQPGISVNCSLSRGNRFEMVAGRFPMSCVLLQPVLKRLLDEHWEASLPSNYQLLGIDSAFAEFIDFKIRSGELDIEYLPEILAYERACLELASLSDSEDPSAIVEFAHSPDDLLPPLSRLEAPPPGLEVSRFLAKVTFREGRFDVELGVPAPPRHRSGEVVLRRD